MRQIILFFLILINIADLSAQDAGQKNQSDSIAETMSSEFKGDFERQVAEAYIKKDYAKAINLLETKKQDQLLQGLESADLYYNLGNTYFRDGEIAKALLYYERALLLKPNDQDIRHNIAYLNTRIEDKIEIGQTFFLSGWMSTLQQTTTSSGWAWFAIVAFIILVGCLFLFFFTNTILPKQVAFYSGLVCIVLIIISNVFAFRQKSSIQQRNTAIIMAPAVIVRNSPDKNSNQVFTLHSGTKVKIRKTDRQWNEIEIANGNVGWIMQDKLEII